MTWLFKPFREVLKLLNSVESKFPTELWLVFIMKPSLGDASRMRLELSSTVKWQDAGLFTHLAEKSLPTKGSLAH